MTSATTDPSTSKQDPPSLATADDPVAIERIQKGQTIIRRNVYWAMGLGVVPIPVLDLITVTGVQIKLLKELSGLYGQRFFENTAKNLVASLVSGLGTVGLVGAAAGSLAKFVPFVGLTVGIIGMPVTAGAFTYAVGRIFQTHFESGGTLLSFNAEAMRAHFREEFEKAKAVVLQMPKDDPSKVQP